MKQRTALIAIVAVLLLGGLLFALVYWGSGPSLNCARPDTGPAQPGWSARTVISGGIERCYHLYVPEGVDPAQPAPLVVSLHGFSSNPNSQAWVSGWPELADREGFMLALPQGTSWPQRWNAGATWQAGVDDVQFFRDLLEDLNGAAALDRARVYVNGLSNGGGMAVRIGCEAGDQVAAIGAVAAAVVDLPGCAGRAPLPAIAFHGTADPIVPYEGGELRERPWRDAAGPTRAPIRFVGFEEWTERWAADNGCAAVPEALPAQGDVRGERFVECGEGAEVIRYTIEEGGHTWPGGRPLPIVGKTTQAIDATEEMWRFFQRFRLEGAN